jgi:hypothetical protein
MILTSEVVGRILTMCHDTRIKYAPNPCGDGEQTYSAFYKTSDICQLVCKEWLVMLTNPKPKL